MTWTLFVISFRSLVWMSQFLCLRFLHPCMCWILCFKYGWYVLIMKLKWSYGSGIIILRSLEKKVPWKFWLDPRFPRKSKSKWTLKWLPLDRGYFKFYFHKGESILIIPCHIYLLARNLVVLFQVMFALPCTLFLLNCPVI